MSEDSEFIPVRLSHLFRHCAVGGIVRGRRHLVVVADIREWTDRQGHPGGRLIPYVEQVRATLEITQELREPPLAAEGEKERIDGVPIPAYRFPGWMRCPDPGCGHLYYRPWRKQGADRLTCSKCAKAPPLEQVSWVLAHSEGHLADVPWHFLAHSSRDSNSPEQNACANDLDEIYLRLIQASGGRNTLRCTRCDVSAPFRPGARIAFPSTRRQPWLRPGELDAPADIPQGLGEIVEVNDVRLHRPQTDTAIVIPPESRIRRGSPLDRVYSSSDLRRKITTGRTALARRSAIGRAAQELRCAPADVEDAVKEIEAGYPLYGATLTPGNLLEKEYEALTESIPHLSDGEDFVTRHLTEQWHMLGEGLSDAARKVVNAVGRLVEVSRLKEIMVLKGLSRLGDDDSPQDLVPPDIVGGSPWLPALELYGEGVFFTLEEGALSAWEQLAGVKERTRGFLTRYTYSGLHFTPELTVTPRFLLLHTLAHLLIRQLETAAGYPAASLKERIYHASGREPMAGILIYVTVPDAVGSLGGLVEQAAPERFLRLLGAAFDRAAWCSLDPVCSEHEGQGPNQLNRAACHACALVPETSCSFQNVLLDRGFIKGDVHTGLPPFLDFAQSAG